MKKLDLKKKKTIFKKEIFVVVVAILLTTVGIKAADSMLGKKGEEPCSEDMIFVPASTGGFCIDKYEVSTSSDCPNQDPSSQAESQENNDDPTCTAKSVEEHLPWRYINQVQAQVACAKAGKRLPTNKEWMTAALGTPDPEMNWSAADCQVASNWNKQPGLTGSGKNCKSSFGSYDMIGNLWEWVDGTIYNGYYNEKKMPSEGYIVNIDGDAVPFDTSEDNPDDSSFSNDYLWIKNSGIRAFARGGYWNNKSEAGVYSVYLVAPPSFVGPGIGFRCVK